MCTLRALSLVEGAILTPSLNICMLGEHPIYPTSPKPL